MKGSVDVLDTMISWVKEDKWCRDVTDNYRGQHCTQGLLVSVIPSDAPLRKELERLLDSTIPAEKLAAVASIGASRNGGTSRGVSDAYSRVCTFNNTCDGPDEIINWYERAKAAAST